MCGALPIRNRDSVSAWALVLGSFHRLRTFAVLRLVLRTQSSEPCRQQFSFFLFQVKGCKNWSPFLEDFHVFGVVVRRPVFPAPEEDPNPFKGQSSNDGVIFFAFGSVVIDVVASPLAAGYGEPSELMKALPLKLGAGPPEINHSGFAAAFAHRTDAGKGLNVWNTYKPGSACDFAHSPARRRPNFLLIAGAGSDTFFTGLPATPYEPRTMRIRPVPAGRGKHPAGGSELTLN